MTRSGRSKSPTEGPSASAARSGTISRSIPVRDTDFIDLVFNIGAPRDVHLGGGTYGFGKTISYVASSVGTILIWSRCEGSSGLEHRLIGSAIGDGFNMDGLRFTGRHWWGNVIASEGRVEPAVGDLAEELGEAVFATRFDRDVTGTSILILDPQLGGDSSEKNVALLAEAVVWNLWPKLLAEQSGRLANEHHRPAQRHAHRAAQHRAAPCAEWARSVSAGSPGRAGRLRPRSACR